MSVKVFSSYLNTYCRRVRSFVVPSPKKNLLFLAEVQHDIFCDPSDHSYEQIDKVSGS